MTHRKPPTRAPGDSSLSQTRNQTHANQMIDMSGAVRRRISPRSILIARIFRLARLCVLIVNPIPARRSIHLDLAGSGIRFVPLPALSIRPRRLTG